MSWRIILLLALVLLLRPLSALALTIPAYESQGTWLDAGFGASITIAAPSSFHTGDLLVAHLVTFYSQTALTGPSGWNASVIGASTTNDWSWIWWKIATATDTPASTYQWTVAIGGGSGGSGQDYLMGVTSAFTGVSASTPIDPASAGTLSSSNNGVTPSVTPSKTGELLLGMWSYSFTAGVAASLTTVYDFSTADGAGSMGYIAAPAAGIASAQYTGARNAGSAMALLLEPAGTIKQYVNPTIKLGHRHLVKTWRR